MREVTIRAVGALKKYFSHVFHFWKQQYFNKKRNGIVAIVVKCKHMVPGSIPYLVRFLANSFFHKNYSDPPKKAGSELGQTFQNCLTFIYIKTRP
jgi:hypothetical protein